MMTSQTFDLVSMRSTLSSSGYGKNCSAKKKERIKLDKFKTQRSSVTFDLRRPPKVCCINVVSCNRGSTTFSPPKPSRHIDCIDVTRNLYAEKDGISKQINQHTHIHGIY